MGLHRLDKKMVGINSEYGKQFTLGRNLCLKKKYLKNVWWKENFGPDKIYPKILGS